MFVPKWLVFILFAVSIGSVVALLLVLSSKPGRIASTPAPTTVIQVSATPHVSASPVVSASPSGMPAAADWQKFKNTDISVAFDYPTGWTATTLDSAVVVSNNKALTESTSSAVPANSVRIVVSREKKPKSSYSLSDYKKAHPADGSEDSIKIDTFDGLDRTAKDSSNRTIVFTTRNYIYSITIVPANSSLKPVVDELLKSVEII